LSLIPDWLCAPFAAAKRIFVIADYHRPLVERDINRHRTRVFLETDILFLASGDTNGLSSIRNEVSAVGSNEEYLAQDHYLLIPARPISPADLCKRKWDQHKIGDNDLVLLYSFNGINIALADAVRQKGGFMVLVQNVAAPTADIQEHYWHTLDDGMEWVMKTMTSLRRNYQLSAQGL
jgi:hypothetical protein